MLRGEIQHALQGYHRPFRQRPIHRHPIAALEQRVIQAIQRIHGHPGAVGTTAAGGVIARCRCHQELLVRRQLLQLVEDALVRGHDECRIGQRDCRLNDLRGRTDDIRNLQHGVRRFGVRQYRRLGMQSLEIQQPSGLEFLVHNAGTVPQQHVCPGTLLDVSAQVLIRRPDDLFALRGKMLHHVHGNA